MFLNCILTVWFMNFLNCILNSWRYLKFIQNNKSPNQAAAMHEIEFSGSVKHAMDGNSILFPEW